MKNPRVSHKEKALIKGALRRVFSRSELRNSIIEASIVVYSDSKRTKVKTWCRCNVCKKLEAKSYMAVDHILPIVKINETAAELDANTLVDRMWCDPDNLQAICPICHDAKSEVERKQRKAYKDANKPPKPKKTKGKKK